MRLVGGISEDVCAVYLPDLPQQTEGQIETEDQNEDRIAAENFNWDIAIVPPLKILCIQTISRMFDRLQPMTVALQQDIDYLIQILPVDTDLRLIVNLISDEGFWKRCCTTKWPDKVFDEYEEPTFWKTIYLTGYLEEYLENAKPAKFDTVEASELAALFSPCIHKLDLKQLQMVEPLIESFSSKDDVLKDQCIITKDVPVDHIPLGPILSQLINLTEIRLVFGVNNLLNALDWRLFELSEADMQSICSGLADLPNIRVLSINRTIFKDINLNVFLRFVLTKQSIEELDFSHCDISDRGIMTIGLVVLQHVSLKVVRLCNNRFGNEGLKGLAYSLQEQPKAPLHVLDLRKNMLSKRGVQYLSSALARCKLMPRQLNISFCGITNSSAILFSGMLRLNKSLEDLDITGNDFSGEAETVLVNSLLKNKNITNLTFAGCGISDEGKKTILDLLKRNKNGKTSELQEEIIQPLYLNDPEYLVWEYNPNNPNHLLGFYPTRIPEKM